jgi:hypothetical protein
MAKITSAELKQGLDVYRRQAKTQGYHVLGQMLAGRVQSGDMTEAERSSLLQKYTETLAKLTDNQTKLLEEYEKTGRVNTTTFSNLISNFAKMKASIYAAQGTENAASVAAYSRRLEQLDNNMSRFGRGQKADLGTGYQKSVASTYGFTDQNGKVNDPSGLAAVLIGDLRNLASSNPELIVPYVSAVEGATKLNINEFLAGKLTNKGQFVEGQTSEIRTYLKAGTAEDAKRADVETEIVKDQGEAVENLMQVTGDLQANKFLKDVLVIYKGVKTETGGTGDVSQLPPPPADATPEQRAEWVSKVSNGRLSLEADGRVHEKVSGAPDVMSYDEFAAYHGPGGMTRVQESMKPYLAETRDTIIKEMDRLRDSTDRPDLETKAHIMGSEAFKEYAKARGYSIADPTLAGQTFKKLLDERKLQMTRGNKDQNMIEDINKMTGVQEATPVGVLAATVRHGLRSAFNPELTNPSARITKGAQAPSEVAPEISEAPAETAKAKADITEPTIHTGSDGFVYKVIGNMVQVVGRANGETEITPDNPIEPSLPESAEILKDLGITVPSTEPSVPLAEAPTMGTAPVAEPIEASDEETPEVDAEVGSDIAEAPVAEAPQQEAAPVEQEAATPEQRRQKRLSALDEARKQAMERVGSEQPEAATTPEGEKADPAAIVKGMIGKVGSGFKPIETKPMEIPGLSTPPAPLGPSRASEQDSSSPELTFSPISRRRRFELLRGLEQ